MSGTQAEAYRRGYDTQQVKRLWRTREFEHRKRNLMRPVTGVFDFYMMHIHFADALHHMTGARIDRVPSQLESEYRNLDQFSSDIITEFSEEFDYMVFMSDHGLPTDSSHNKNAFYSCNKELFGDKTPHITDFHDKILELTGSETSDIDV